MGTSHKQLVIVGPTASGKSCLAMNIAMRVGGEIICGDSRTIYSMMDIGTAKPSKADVAQVRHHLLDILDPDQSFSASEFKRLSQQSIAQIRKRRHLPIIVGGSGLYIYGLVYDYKFPAGANNQYRETLNKMSVVQLREKLQRANPEIYGRIDINNPRRLIRAIETADQPPVESQNHLSKGTLLVGLFPGFDELSKSINVRTDEMIKQGLVEETRGLLATFGQVESLNTVGYKEIRECLEGEYDLDEATQLIKLHTLQLAKRQMTWFKRNKDIVWHNETSSAKRFIEDWLKS